MFENLNFPLTIRKNEVKEKTLLFLHQKGRTDVKYSNYKIVVFRCFTPYKHCKSFLIFLKLSMKTNVILKYLLNVCCKKEMV